MAHKKSAIREALTYNKYWFKARKSGFGWTPASWEGWVVIGTYIAVVLVNYYRIDRQMHSVGDTMVSFLPETFILTFLLFYIFIKKGEDPRRRR